MAGICPFPLDQIAGMMGGSSGGTPTRSRTGDVTMAADGNTDTFIIPHGMGAMPGYANVVAKNELAIGDYSVVWDTANITIMYSFAPTAGQLKLTWIATPSV